MKERERERGGGEMSRIENEGEKKIRERNNSEW